MHGFEYKYISSKKIGLIFKTFYTQFKIVRSGYNAKLVIFDLHTLMKIIQILMSSKNVCYIIIWKLCE